MIEDMCSIPFSQELKFDGIPKIWRQLQLLQVSKRLSLFVKTMSDI